MSVITVPIVSEFSRRMPDPVFRDRKMDRYIFFCRAKDVPPDVPRDPNPRHQNIDRGIYLDVGKSLRNELGTEGTFHLKNKGITVIAKKVRETEKGSYEILLETGQGIVDGAHTYDVIRKAILDGECPDNQYVRIEVLTGVESDLISEIAGGLNTAMQVQAMSLANLEGKFDWLKKVLKPNYREVVVFRENEEGEFDVRDVVALLTLFNIELYPNDGSEYPLKAYTSKSATLEQYIKHMRSFERMAPIVNDILELHDHVHVLTRVEHNKASGKAGKLAFVRGRKRGEFTLPFTGQKTKYMLFDGALYPMLGAFRWMVQKDKDTGQMVWKSNDGLEGVLALLKKVGSELMRSTQDKSVALGRNPNAIGKDRGHWENLFKTVALREMQGPSC